MDEMRRAALAERTEIMARTRAEADAEIAAAGEKLQAEVEQARRVLTAEAEKLGSAAAERILGRKAAS
jgi:F0F1-type ATP synthase membrane subunit b/b'